MNMEREADEENIVWYIFCIPSTRVWDEVKYQPTVFPSWKRSDAKIPWWSMIKTPNPNYGSFDVWKQPQKRGKLLSSLYHINGFWKRKNSIIGLAPISTSIANPKKTAILVMMKRELMTFDEIDSGALIIEELPREASKSEWRSEGRQFK